MAGNIVIITAVAIPAAHFFSGCKESFFGYLHAQWRVTK
tara:strand:- start:1283 stop:1399 length:117 start_codon:yes stop_codon:yes gene_type:complete